MTEFEPGPVLEPKNEMKISKKNKLKNIVAFCALMQNGSILDQSPDYILEKFERYCTSNWEDWRWGLDSNRRQLLSKWCKKWLNEDAEFE